MLSLDRIISAILACSAVALSASMVHREFFRAPIARAAAQDQHPVYVRNWKQILPHGIEIGNPAAKIKLVEFADFECPFCRSFHSRIQQTLMPYAGQVSVVFVHLPLNGHRFARPAARAAECAASQGRFGASYDALYKKQDSLGLKTWESYAKESAVSRLDEFNRCVSSSSPIARIDEGVAIADRLDIHATPTVLLNGWRFPNPPADSTLIEAIQALLAGKSPTGSR